MQNINNLINAAKQLRVEEKFQEAIEIYETVLSLEPENQTALLEIGATFCELQQPEKAKSYLQYVENQYSANIILGLSYFATLVDSETPEYYAELVIYHFEKALEIETFQDSYLYYYMAESYQYANEDDSAIECYKKYLEFDDEEYAVGANIAIAYDYFTKDEFESALAYILQAMELDNTIFYTYEILSRCCFELERYEETLQTLFSMLIFEENQADIYEFIALTYIKLHQYTDALQYAQKAVEISPYSTDALCILAECYEANNEIELAKSFYKQALTIDKECQEAKEALEKYS